MRERDLLWNQPFWNHQPSGSGDHWPVLVEKGVLRGPFTRVLPSKFQHSTSSTQTDLVSCSEHQVQRTSTATLTGCLLGRGDIPDFLCMMQPQNGALQHSWRPRQFASGQWSQSFLVSLMTLQACCNNALRGADGEQMRSQVCQHPAFR